MSSYERMQIIDSMKEEWFSAGNVVMTQGEPGDKFYMIEEGQVQIIKDTKDIGMLKVGEYFGELALINNAPRAATIKCKTNCKLVTIDRLTFKRLIGSVENLMKNKKYS